MSDNSWAYDTPREIVPVLTSIFKELKSLGFKVVGQGRHRRGMLFPSGKYILKVPINTEGEQANLEEAERYQTDYSEKGARCRLIYYKDFPCIVMEMVKPAVYSPDCPFLKEVDCGQVGYNRRGKIVAYDYSYC